MRQFFRQLVVVATLSLPVLAAAQPALLVKPLAEKRVDALPDGTLFWRIENLPSLAAAQTAAGPTALAVEVGVVLIVVRCTTNCRLSIHAGCSGTPPR